jgi:hypothetical protein
MQLTDSNSEPRYELQPNELRKFKGFEKLSDGECLETIHQLQKLRLISCRYIKGKASLEIDQRYGIDYRIKSA